MGDWVRRHRQARVLGVDRCAGRPLLLEVRRLRWVLAAGCKLLLDMCLLATRSVREVIGLLLLLLALAWRRRAALPERRLAGAGSIAAVEPVLQLREL